MVSILVFLAFAFVGADHFHHDKVLSHIKNSRLFDGALSALGNLCGVFESIDFAAELILYHAIFFL